MNKKLNYFAYAIATAGIVSQLMAFVPTGLKPGSIYYISVIKSLLNTIELMFPQFNDFIYINLETGLYTNYLNLTVYILLLLGAILWSLSNGRETRLVRMFLGIVLFEQALFFVSNILYGLIYFKQGSLSGWSILFFPLGVAERALLFYFLLKFLKEYQQNRLLEGEVVANEDVTVTGKPPELVTARWFKRLSNMVIDVVLCVVTLLPFASTNQAIETLEEKVGYRSAFMIFLIAARLVYYIFFESLLEASPGKLFTETRVIKEYGDDKRPSFQVAALRTLFRFIPLEPLSFVFSREGGWHDRISNTQVVNEVRTGVRLWVYWSVFPIMILMATLYFLAREKYHDYQSYLRLKRNYESEIFKIKDHLSNLDTACVIKFRNVDEPYTTKTTFLKIIEANNDDLTAYVIETTDDKAKSIKQVEDTYLRGKASGFLSVVPLKRSDLGKAFTEDYDQSEKDDRNSIDLFDDKRRFEIETIDRMFRPSIRDYDYGSLGGSDNGISLTMLNYGWPAKIVSLETLEGTIKWYDFMDVEAPTVRRWNQPSFTIMGESYKHGEPYKVRMVLRDTLGRDYTYMIEGTDLEKTVKLIE